MPTTRVPSRRAPALGTEGYGCPLCDSLLFYCEYVCRTFNPTTRTELIEPSVFAHPSLWCPPCGYEWAVPRDRQDGIRQFFLGTGPLASAPIVPSPPDPDREEA